MLNSHFREIGPAVLPYQGRQLYMAEVDPLRVSMPAGFGDYNKVIDDLLYRAGVQKGPVFVTVDEKVVQPGQSQRKPGPHVDGCFIPQAGGYWGHGGGQPGYWGHTPPPPPAPRPGYWGHGGGGWNHSCNLLPTPRMSVIVAASVPGCRAWEGQFEGQPDEHGDLSHIADQLGEGVVLPANVGFLLSPDCIHESMIFDKPTRRSFLRLALPVEG